MANRLTRGEALVGALSVDTDISAADISATGGVDVTGDINVADDVYVTGAFGYGTTAATIADGTAMAFTAANLLGGLILSTPTEERNIAAPTAANILAAVDADDETGLTFDFSVINKGAGTAVLTLTTATGVTYEGVTTVAGGASATFAARLVPASTAVVIYRK
jgi:hypothetical protein